MQKARCNSPFATFNIMPDSDINARKVFQSRYLCRDRQHQLIETPEALFSRVARAIAGAESNIEKHEGDSTKWRWQGGYHPIIRLLPHCSHNRIPYKQLSPPHIRMNINKHIIQYRQQHRQINQKKEPTPLMQFILQAQPHHSQHY